MREFAGTLAQRIEVMSRSEERLPSGASASNWSTVARCLAAIEVEGAGPPTEGMSLSALPRFRVTVRAGPSFAVDQQVRWKGKHLAIRHIIVDPRLPDRIELRCEELR